MNKPNQTKTNTQIQGTEWWFPEGKGEMDKGDELYGDGQKIKFWW